MADIKFTEIVAQRYATKKFGGKPLPESKVRELLGLVRLAASSFNLQPWKIKVVNDQETKDLIKEAAWGQEQIGTASHVLVFCADTDLEPLVKALHAEMKEGHPEPEKLDPYIGMMSDFVKGMDDAKRLAWAQRQVYLALGNALNGAKALGFDSCPMEGFDPQKVAQILKLPPNIVPTALCPIGHATDRPQKKIRFAMEKILL